MARRSRTKSGTFFLRKTTTTDGATFTTSSIDVSSFIDVLNGELIRVKQVWWEWQSDAGGPILGADLGASKGCSAFASVSTESRTTVGSLGSTDIMAMNYIYAHTDAATDIDFIGSNDSINPKDFDDGFLVATDAIHVNTGNSADVFANDVRVTAMLECEIVKLSLSDAQAVLVSQTIG